MKFWRLLYFFIVLLAKTIKMSYQTKPLNKLKIFLFEQYDCKQQNVMFVQQKLWPTETVQPDRSMRTCCQWSAVLSPVNLSSQISTTPSSERLLKQKQKKLHFHYLARKINTSYFFPRMPTTGIDWLCYNRQSVDECFLSALPFSGQVNCRRPIIV